MLQGGGVFLKGLQRDRVGQGTTFLNNCKILNNTASFGGGMACSACRAVLSDVQLEGNNALLPADLQNMILSRKAPTALSSNSSGNSSQGILTPDAWQGAIGGGTQDVSGHEQGWQRPYVVAGVGGGIAANLAGNSFVVLLNGSTLDNNRAQQLGGGVYLNSSTTCQRDLIPGQYQGEKAPCGVLIDSEVVVGSENKAVLGGALVAWTGQAAFHWCCSNSRGGTRGQQCFNATERPLCQGSQLWDADPAELYGTLPAQMLAFNNSCLMKHIQLNESAAAAAPKVRGDPPLALQYAGQPIPDWTKQCLMTGQAASPQLYSGGVLAMTVVVLDEYDNIMNMQRSYLAESSARPMSSDWDGMASGEDGPQLLVEQSDMSLFVIGELRADLNVTAQFANLSLQPVQPPRENILHNFTLAPTKESDILRQVCS
jgi:hypothetical protein